MTERGVVVTANGQGDPEPTPSDLPGEEITLEERLRREVVRNYVRRWQRLARLMEEERRRAREAEGDRRRANAAGSDADVRGTSGADESDGASDVAGS